MKRIPWFSWLLVFVGPLHAEDGGAHAVAPAETGAAPLERFLARPSPGDVTREEQPTVFYDEPGDGNLWVRGGDYKASFGSAGATYIPYFGSRAPHNFPLSLSPNLVTIGGAPLEFARSASAARRGERIEIPRGAFDERYDIALDSIEQSFVFSRLERRGEIVVHIPVETELEGSLSAEGLDFCGEWGRVHYSGAVALDARGRRVAAPTDIVDGQITIRVPADFVATAALPLVIDPVISTFLVDDPYLTAHSVDLCWEPSFDCWLVTYDELYSASDNDVRVRIVNHDGTIRHSGYVDFTSANWLGPKCAGLAAWAQCLVVATKPGASSSVVGREVWTLNLAMYPQITISRSQDGPAQNPVVGGSPLADASAHYVVAYERVYAPGDRDIFARRVQANNTFLGSAPTNIGMTTTYDQFRPQISRSTLTGDHLIVWERRETGLQYSAVSVWVTPTSFYVPTSIGPLQPNPWNLSLSSRSGTFGDYVITSERHSGSASGMDIQVRVLTGSGGSYTWFNLSRAEGWDPTSRLVESSIEVLGDRAVIAYAHRLSASNHDLYVAEIAVNTAQPIQLIQSRVPLATSGLDERRPRITGMYIEGDTNPAYYRDCVIGWDDNANSGRVQGAIFRGN